MAWTAPRTWVANAVLTAAQLNEQIRDNMNVLAPSATGQGVLRKNSAGSSWEIGAGVIITDSAANTTDRTSTSGTLADITGMSVSVTTRGGWIEVSALPAGAADGANPTDLMISANNGIAYMAAVVGAVTLPRQRFGAANGAQVVIVTSSSLRWTYKPAAGTYTVKLQWMQTGTGTLSWNLTGTGGVIVRVTEFLGT